MNFYLSKYSFSAPQISSQPKPDLGLIIVIPCFNEPDIITSLTSLNQCDPPHQNVEILIVINSGEHHSSQIKKRNQQTISEIRNWKNSNTLNYDFHIIEAHSLPKKHAGVGLARKIGMDEAIARFENSNNEGIIICFDADSKCAKNYLLEIENHFNNNPKSPGCAIRYEHPIEGDEFDQKIYKGIINYELFLRYYNQGLCFANLPYAYHTVGSSMAIRSTAYQKQGGMNKRKAGEDFYFLHKIIALGNFTELNSTMVIPSPRTSDRVPFGTGKAINDWIESNDEIYLTYDFRIWLIIKDFVNIIPELQTKNLDQTDFFNPVQNKPFIQFLDANQFNHDLKEIRKNSTDSTSFLKRFFVWFNAFRVLKLVHYLRDEQYPNKPIFNEAKAMAIARGFYNGERNNEALLIRYREKEYDLLPN